MLDLLPAAFATVFQWHNLLAIVSGAPIGIIVGAIPGLNQAMAVAIALPITFYLPPETAIIFLMATYKGGNFGGAIPAIFLNTPGTPAAIATTLDGFPLSQKGEGLKWESHTKLTLKQG